MVNRVEVNSDPNLRGLINSENFETTFEGLVEADINPEEVIDFREIRAFRVLEVDPITSAPEKWDTTSTEPISWRTLNGNLWLPNVESLKIQDAAATAYARTKGYPVNVDGAIERAARYLEARASARRIIGGMTDFIRGHTDIESLIRGSMTIINRRLNTTKEIEILEIHPTGKVVGEKEDGTQIHEELYVKVALKYFPGVEVTSLVDVGNEEIYKTFAHVHGSPIRRITQIEDVLRGHNRGVIGETEGIGSRTVYEIIFKNSLPEFLARYYANEDLLDEFPGRIQAIDYEEAIELSRLLVSERLIHARTQWTRTANEERGILTQAFAHRIRTPLGNIYGRARDLLNDFLPVLALIAANMFPENYEQAVDCCLDNIALHLESLLPHSRQKELAKELKSADQRTKFELLKSYAATLPVGQEAYTRINRAFTKISQIERIAEQNAEMLESFLNNIRGNKFPGDIITVREYVSELFKIYTDGSPQEGIRYRNDIPDDFRLTLERGELHGIMNALIENARQNTPSDGEIIAAASMRDNYLQIHNRPAQLPPGLDIDSIHVSSHNSTGLGIPLLRDACERNGMKLSRYNENDGVTFRIDLRGDAYAQ